MLILYLFILDMSSDADDDDDDGDDDESDEVSDFEDTLRRPAKKKTSDRSTKKVKTTSLAEGTGEVK